LHDCVLQACEFVDAPEPPGQYAPPYAGAGLVHERVCVCVPPPQEAEQLLQPDHPDHPPFTGAGFTVTVTESVAVPVSLLASPELPVQVSV
jgi:hypothetical protein